jgi:hypothetical protein
MSDVIQATVEIAEPEIKVVNEVPTREDVKARGWSKAEIESAEKRGMISKPKKEEEKEPTAVKAEEKPEQKPEEKVVEAVKVEENAGKRSPSGIPAYDLTEDQQKALEGILPPGNPMRGIYFRMKNERTARQRLEAELTKERAAREALEAKLTAPQAAKAEGEGEQTEDPEDRPLTIRALRELEAQNAKESERRAQEVNARASAVAEAQQAQEEYAREIYPDFDDTVTRAKEVIKNLDAIPEPWKRAKAVKLFRDLQEAAARADSLGLDDYNGAIIAYEIGQLHPLHGKKADEQTNGNALRPEAKANGGLTPDKMKRIEENTLRRASSASVAGGGGRRAVSPEDVTLADINRMTSTQRLSFRDKHPDQYARLLRG